MRCETMSKVEGAIADGSLANGYPLSHGSAGKCLTSICGWRPPESPNPALTELVDDANLYLRLRVAPGRWQMGKFCRIQSNVAHM